MIDKVEKPINDDGPDRPFGPEPLQAAPRRGGTPLTEVLSPVESRILLHPGAIVPGQSGGEEGGRTEIRRTSSHLTQADRFDHVLARLGYHRGEHRVEPGLYALGEPTPESAVFVTANYTLSFDALRSSLPRRDAYILVLDTAGINVWCAAGKGTFGTDELVRRIASVHLGDVVNRRRLIVPQLGVTGVAAHEVLRRSGFRVEYGPIRAADLPAYLDAGGATEEMRRVTFSLRERVVLIPVELVHSFMRTAIAAAVLYVLGGTWGALAAVGAVSTGTVLFPICLPWLPTADFSSKGFVLGGIVALTVAVGAYRSGTGPAGWDRTGSALGYLLSMPAVTAYLALNFTGSTTITSQSGVKREMYRYIRIMAVMAALGAVLILVSGIDRWMGG